MTPKSSTKTPIISTHYLDIDEREIVEFNPGKQPRQCLSQRKSLRAAINSKCKECVYDSQDYGRWRQQVENCTSYQCALFDVRPKSNSEVLTNVNRSVAVSEVD